MWIGVCTVQQQLLFFSHPQSRSASPSKLGASTRHFWVHKYTKNVPQSFSRRVEVNVQILVKSEYHWFIQFETSPTSAYSSHIHDFSADILLKVMMAPPCNYQPVKILTHSTRVSFKLFIKIKKIIKLDLRLNWCRRSGCLFLSLW